MGEGFRRVVKGSAFERLFHVIAACAPLSLSCYSIYTGGYRRCADALDRRLVLSCAQLSVVLWTRTRTRPLLTRVVQLSARASWLKVQRVVLLSPILLGFAFHRAAACRWVSISSWDFLNQTGCVKNVRASFCFWMHRKQGEWGFYSMALTWFVFCCPVKCAYQVFEDAEAVGGVFGPCQYIRIRARG